MPGIDVMHASVDEVDLFAVAGVAAPAIAKHRSAIVVGDMPEASCCLKSAADILACITGGSSSGWIAGVTGVAAIVAAGVIAGDWSGAAAGVASAAVDSACAAASIFS